MNPVPEDPKKLAQRCADIMLSGDAPAKAFGFSLRRAAPGEAALEMIVSQNGLNIAQSSL
jgi:hypothetical protein